MKRIVMAALALSVAPAFAQHGHHAGMQMPQAQPAPMQPAQDPQAADAPSPFPAPTAAERAAAFPPELEGMDMRTHMDDNPLVAVLRGDELERGDGDSFGWDLGAGIGRNLDKLWLRSEGEHRDDRIEHARTELLWTHAIGPWWDRTIGLRHDSGSGGPGRDWAAIGVQGLAPYKFELEATGYIGASGRLAARFEGEYEILLTNRFILQPKLEANLYSQDDDDNRIGKGLSDVEFGLRLRYEFSPRFAPYAGHVWTRRFGGTADRHDADGGAADEHGWVAGIRFWF